LNRPEWISELKIEVVTISDKISQWFIIEDGVTTGEIMVYESIDVWAVIRWMKLSEAYGSGSQN
jgi:hypothetical protein